jgi:hypothetical protein
MHVITCSVWSSLADPDVVAALFSGNTMDATLTILKEWGVKRIKVMSLVATKQGIPRAYSLTFYCTSCDAFRHAFATMLCAALEMLQGEHSDVEFVVGAVDEMEAVRLLRQDHPLSPPLVSTSLSLSLPPSLPPSLLATVASVIRTSSDVMKHSACPLHLV